MAKFRYNLSNLPTWYPTTEHAPCAICSSHGACTSSFDRSVYLCTSVQSHNPMPHLNGWVHALDRQRGDPEYWNRFLRPSAAYWRPSHMQDLANALNTRLHDLFLYPFAVDPIYGHGVLPAMAADGTVEGVHLFRSSGPQVGSRFMLRGSKASPTFPRKPASGSRLYCMPSIADAVQGQAAGFDTVFSGSHCISARGVEHLAEYAKACNAAELVFVAESTSDRERLDHLTKVGKHLQRASGGLHISLAQVPEEHGDFGTWDRIEGLNPPRRLPGERLINLI